MSEQVADVTRERLPRLRKIIGARMVESLQTSAQLTTVVEADVTELGLLRNRVKDDFLARVGVSLSYLPFLAKAAVESLQEHPVINAALDADAGTVEYHRQQHLGIAVDTARGLLVPVVRDAGSCTVTELATRIADLAERARAGTVTGDELTGGTFTLTNTGSRGALFDTPIVNPPQSAILGTGAVVRRAVPITGVDGMERIEARSVVMLALSYDHRLIDGADAARFLTHLGARLQGANFTV